MSVKATSLVWEHSRATGVELLVLLAIADYTNDDGRAWPSQDTIARKARCSDRTVRRVVDRLVELGELAVLREGGGRGRSAVYRLTLTRTDRPGSVGNPDSDDTERWTSTTVKVDTAVSTEPLGTVKRTVNDDARETSDADRFAAAVAAEGPQGANVTAKAALVELHVGKLHGWQVGILHQALMDAEGGVVALAAEAHLADRPAAWFGNQLRAGAHVDPKRRIAPGSDRQVAKAAKARSHAEANERVARFLARAGR